MPPTLLAFDTETHLITPGNLAPKPVIASFADGSSQWAERFYNPHDADSAEETIDGGLLRPGVTVAGANIAYDWAVVARRVPSLLKAIFAKYQRGEIWDIEIVAALDAVAAGRMTDGKVTGHNGQPLRRYGDSGPVTNRFSLLNCVYLYLNRLDAKVNNEHVLRYGELSKLPSHEWPESARQYPLDDARNTYDVAVVQRQRAQNTGPIGKLLPGVTWETFQARAAFAMHLGSVWGFRTDGERIDAIMAKVNATLEADNKKFLEWGFLKEVTEWADDARTIKVTVLKENRSAIKRTVALAYGAAPLDVARCVTCDGTGKTKSEKTGAEVNCKTCDSTGLLLPNTVPRTPADGIATDRDTLDGTDNKRLEAWAEAGKNDKMRTTYGPWLELGTNAPINVRPNPLVATGRCSYDGLVQLIPPIARECIKARDGVITFHDVPDDYTLQPGEEWADDSL